VVTICTTSLTFNNSTFCPHSVFMCFVWIWEKTAIISLYSINSVFHQGHEVWTWRATARFWILCATEHSVLLKTACYWTHVLLKTVCYWTHVLLNTCATEHGVLLNTVYYWIWCYCTFLNKVCYWIWCASARFCTWCAIARFWTRCGTEYGILQHVTEHGVLQHVSKHGVTKNGVLLHASVHGVLL